MGDEVEFTVDFKGRQANFFYTLPGKPAYKLFENLPQEVFPFATLLYNEDKVSLLFK